ncbi:MAG: hypothetical protein MUE30_04175 [Spirosomaceae bacterium]|nr:hypothetical protein [Spirosomataceae bacterium]
MKTWLPIVLLLVALRGMAQEDVMVKLLNLPQNIKAGDRFAVVAEITCPQPMSNRVWMEVRLPASWQIITKKVPARIVGLKSARFSYTVSVGRQAEAGIQVVEAVVYKNGLENFRQWFETEVERIRRVEITAVNLPPYVKEGQQLRTEYLIHNHGNAPEQLSLSTTRGQIEQYNGPILLKTKASIKVFVTQEIPITDGSAWTAAADLKATPADSIQPVYKVVTVPVFANKTKANDPYLRFPVEAGVWYNAIRGLGREAEGYQFDVRGQGYVDLNKKHYIDFVAHGPNQMDLPIIGAFDQYSFHYTNTRHDISLGDYALTFSKLIEPNSGVSGETSGPNDSMWRESMFARSSSIGIDLSNIPSSFSAKENDL